MLMPGFFDMDLATRDPAIATAIAAETGRQRQEIELIASENIVSRAVLEAQGSTMTNKYAEGYPGRRYYGGCEFVDVAETLAIERAKRLFGCAFANVQPNSGSQANQGVYTALLQPGDTILGMSLDAGGHLTHVPGLDTSSHSAARCISTGMAHTMCSTPAARPTWDHGMPYAWVTPQLMVVLYRTACTNGCDAATVAPAMPRLHMGSQ